MQPTSRHELYLAFLEFISRDIQHERRVVNKRMFHVFFWCFLVPVIISISVLVLIKIKVLPLKFKSNLDWIVLIVPTVYSIYILSSEVLSQVPKVFRKGAVANSLSLAATEGEWRQKVVDRMTAGTEVSVSEWKWIVTSFQIDLDGMRSRTRYLTALAGAVFFLVMQGIDSIGEPEAAMEWVKSPLVIWARTSLGDVTQFVGLALFLVLLYLSGIQNYNQLKRYLSCAELLVQRKSEPGGH